MKAIMSLNTNGLYRFDGFELDPSRRVLTREEEPVPLTPKAFDVLSFLVLNPGRVVTKDELLKAVWPDSFVEEGNLAQYISALRKALGEKSCLIVTVPGRGYQFAAQVLTAPLPAEIPVETLPQAHPGDVFVQRVRERTRVVYEDAPAAPPAQPQPALLLNGKASSRTRVWRWVGASVLAGALIALAATQAWRHFAHPPQLSDVVVADFTNTTRDATFDSTLNQALQIDLEQSPYLNLLSRQKIRETLKLMERGGDEGLTPELAREVCVRDNAQAVLHGTIANFGSKYLLTLAAEGCADGRQIAAYKEEAASKEEILGALDTGAARMRKRLGESAVSLKRFQTPVEQATTSSLEALQAFSQGQKSYDHGEMKTALGLFERAVALDPSFATAYRSIGASYYNLSDYAQAAMYSKKAFDLRERTTERERLNIEIAYYYFGNYDLEAAVRSLKLYIQTYPNSSMKSWSNLCNLYTQLGDYGQAIAAGEQAQRMDPDNAINAEILARAYKRASRFADAKRVANAAVAEGTDRWGVHSILFQTAFAERDSAKIKTEGEWGLTHGRINLSLYNLAFAAATGGRLRAAIDYFDRARTESLRGGDADFADSALHGMARVMIEFGDPARAREALKPIKKNAYDAGDLAFLQAATGDIASAQQFIAASSSLTEKNTFHIYCDLPLVRAQLALQAHKPADAVQLLEPARPFQLRDFSVPYLRAQAETEAGMLDAAAEDYRLILANQGVDPISPLYPLAHLRMARVLVLQKKTGEARQQFQAFFDAWKDADSNLPLLQTARSEFARLR
jgi:DNA-binding winged helix-turn-helix (wHTH) protein/tetratricopeptide (TPR) repeat protein